MSTFSREHYLYAAEFLRTAIPSKSWRRDIAIHFADMFTRDNARFERKLFYENCGITDWALITVAEDRH